MSIDQWIRLLASITSIEMMVTIGLGVTIADLLEVARNWRLVFRAALANYLIVPAAATGLLMWFGPHPMVAAGILIAAVCPGAPYGPPFTAIARGNPRLAVGLMVVLAGSSAILAPFLLRVLLPLFASGESLQINAVKMLMTLAVTEFVPLCLGLTIVQKNPRLAGRLLKPAGRLCTLLNLMLLGLILSAQYRMLMEIRLRGYLGMSMLVITALIAGWILGDSGSANRKTLSLTTAVRNVGVALVIASSSFAGTPAVTATTAYGLFQTLAILLIALVWGQLTSGTRIGGLATV